MISLIIMICDDQKNELDNINQIVSEYSFANSELPISVKSFLNPSEMLDAIHKSGAPDIALLDICMPGILGTDVAKEILDMNDSETDVVFLTASSDFAVEAFSLHASDYLTKPYTKERITEALDRVIKKRANRFFLTVSCGREIYRIDIFQILYAEARNHNVEIHLKSGKVLKTHASLSELKKTLLKENCFIAVGASYVVNLRNVQSMLISELEMSDGDIIPVPRRLRNEIREKYFDFYSTEAVGE